MRAAVERGVTRPGVPLVLVEAVSGRRTLLREIRAPTVLAAGVGQAQAATAATASSSSGTQHRSLT